MQLSNSIFGNPACPADLKMPLTPFTVTISAYGNEDCYATRDGWFTIDIAGGTAPYEIDIYLNTVLYKSFISPITTVSLFDLHSGFYDIYVSDNDLHFGQTFINIQDSRLVNWPYQPRNGTLREIGKAITVNGHGTVYAAGYFSGTVDFDWLTLASGGLFNIYLASFDQCGYLQWAVQTRGFDNKVESICLDRDGNIIMVGHFYNTIEFLPSGPVLTSNGLSDAFVAKFSAGDGKCLWACKIGEIREDYATGVAADDMNRIFIFGHYYGQDLNFYNANGVLQYTLPGWLGGTTENFLAIYDQNGNWMDADRIDVSSQEWDFSGRMIWDPDSPSLTRTILYLTGTLNDFDFLGQRVEIEFSGGFPYFTNLGTVFYDYELINPAPNVLYTGKDVAINEDPWGGKQVWFCGDISSAQDHNSFIAVENVIVQNIPFYEMGTTLPFPPPPGDDTATAIDANDVNGTFVVGHYFTPYILLPTTQMQGCQNIGNLAFNSGGMTPNWDFYITNFTTDRCPGQPDWPLASTGMGLEYMYDIQLGQKGQGYVTGSFSGNAACFATMNLFSFQGGADAYITRFVYNDLISQTPAILKPSAGNGQDNPKSGKGMEIILYPNPAHDQVWLYLPPGLKTKAEIDIFTIQGKEIKSFSVSPADIGQDLLLDLSLLEKGCYMVSIKTSERIVIKKLLVN